MAVGAKKPDPGPAVVTIRVGQLNPLFNILPVSPINLLPVEENHTLIFNLNPDTAGGLIVDSPLPSERMTRP
jgi:hypothetical protein